MLWLKAWLETRLRFAFGGAMMFLMICSPLLMGIGRFGGNLRTTTPMLFCITALLLSGAGVNTQTSYGARAGFHGSMLFTLSLPVSRRKLFFVRSGLGALETSVVVLAMCGLTAYFASEPLTALGAINYGARALACTAAVYALFCFLATFLDDQWRIQGGVFCLLPLVFLQARFAWLARISPMTAMKFAATVQWAPVIAAVCCTAVFIWASLWVLEGKDY